MINLSFRSQSIIPRGGEKKAALRRKSKLASKVARKPAPKTFEKKAGQSAEKTAEKRPDEPAEKLDGMTADELAEEQNPPPKPKKLTPQQQQQKSLEQASTPPPVEVNETVQKEVSSVRALRESFKKMQESEAQLEAPVSVSLCKILVHNEKEITLFPLLGGF